MRGQVERRSLTYRMVTTSGYLEGCRFPQEVEYGNGAYRTQETSFLFKGLPAPAQKKSGLVALPGIARATL